MKKKIISTIIAITFCFTPNTNHILATQSVSASYTTQLKIALNNQTKGGSYNITLTDSENNIINETIPTSGSTAYFDNIDTTKEYIVTITHADSPTELWYFGKHTFDSIEYGQTFYFKVADVPVQNYTYTGNYTSLDGFNAKIGVAGAYANIQPAIVHKGYFESYIIPDYDVLDILATFNVNGFVTGDESAIVLVDLCEEYLPAYFAVVGLDSTNSYITSIYYNTNSYPISILNQRMFSINLSGFENSCNFAIVELEPSTQPEINFYNSIEYTYADYNYTATTYSTGNYTKGGSIPTTGYISTFRNVAIGDVINLDALNISGVTGWYYDIIFKNEVKDTSNVVVTESILMNGLYPKYGSERTYTFIN